jgi:Pentapeptide repeats (8 copies)
MRAIWVMTVLTCGCGSSVSTADLSVPDLSEPPDLTGVDFAGVDFSGVDFTTPPLPDLSMRVDLAGADLAAVDMVAVPNIDLAAVDLSAASMFCAGTFVAGTCLQTFFAPLAECFNPAGSCTQQGAGLTPIWCWPNTDELKQIAGASTVQRWYQKGSLVCFTRLIGGAGPGPSYSAGGQTMYFTAATGVYHCPDGTQGSIGTNYGGCAALANLLDPDTTACVAGTCP